MQTSLASLIVEEKATQKKAPLTSFFFFTAISPGRKMEAACGGK
jgi:hypothetical protein